MPDLDIKSETIDKGLDILADSTKETRNTLDKKTSGGLNKFFDLLKSTPLGIKAEVYIAERPYKLQKAMEEMQAKYEKIPEENRVEPSSYIALQTINNLNYALDEEYLKELFTNILISDMDNRKKSRVQPAYIEMVKQLSKEDVNFLKLLNEKNFANSFPVLQLIFKDSTSSSYINWGEKLLIDPNHENDIITIDSFVLHNLLRLNIISNPHGIYLKSYEDLYKHIFEEIAKEPNYKPFFESKLINMKPYFNKEKIDITPLGKSIMDICLS